MALRQPPSKQQGLSTSPISVSWEIPTFVKRNFQVEVDEPDIETFALCDKPIFNIWVDSFELLQTFCDIFADSGELGENAPLRLVIAKNPECELPAWLRGIHLVFEPTSLKICNVHKGLVRIHIEGKDLFSKKDQVLRALWPKHPYYPVDLDSPPELAQSFLPGLTTYSLLESGAGLEVMAWTVPGDDVNELRIQVENALKQVSLRGFNITRLEEVLKPTRSVLDNEVIGLITESFSESGVNGPEFDWHPYPSIFNRVARSLRNVFSFGPGKPNARLSSEGVSYVGLSCANSDDALAFRAILRRLVEKSTSISVLRFRHSVTGGGNGNVG